MRTKTALSCSKCNIWRYTRSRRRGLMDKIMVRVGFVPMRCPKCNRRKYMRATFVSAAQPAE